MKKYQKIFAFLIVFMFLGTSWFYYDNYVKVSGIVKVSEKKSIKSNSAISMMYETEAGSGEYTESEDTTWPSGRYIFNATLSKCENGSSISWDDINKKVLISANTSDRCYVYFDKTNDLKITVATDGVANTLPTGNKYKATLACTGANATYSNKYQRIEIGSLQSGNTICTLNYTKDTTNYTTLIAEIDRKKTLSTNNGGICSKEQYTTESTCTSNDGKWYVVHENDGIRFAGKEPSNYVWFNNELWRIIGNIPTCMSKGSDGKCTNLVDRVKIIRADSIGGLAYHSTTGVDLTWGNGNTLYTLLNEKYYGKVNATGASPCFGYSASSYGLCNYEDIGISNNATDYYGKMVQSVYMNAGTVSSTSTKIYAAYDLEVGTLTTNATRIGLMTASDYGYATSGITYSSVGLLSLSSNTTTNWLYANGYEWTMTPISTNDVLYVRYNGTVHKLGAGSGYAVRPVLYLDSSVNIIGGDGSKLNPYIVGM